MGRAALLTCIATSIACGSRLDDTGRTFVASTDDTLATNLEVLATGEITPAGAVVPIGGKRLLVGDQRGDLVYFDGVAPRTLASAFVVDSSARLANGAMLLLDGHGALHVFADERLAASPLTALLTTPVDAIANGATAFYLLSRQSLFVWRDGGLTEARDVAFGATMLTVGQELFVADATTLRVVDTTAVTSSVLATYANISAIAADSRGGVYVAHGTTVELLDDDRGLTYVFDDEVSALATHRLMPGVWVRTASGDVWYAARGEAPRLAATNVDEVRVDGIGRLVVRSRGTVTRLQRADAADVVVVDDAASHVAIDKPTTIEVSVDDPERVLAITAATPSHDLLVRKNPWRLLASPWVVEAGQVTLTVRSSDGVMERTLGLQVTTSAAPKWSDTVSEIAGASCTACHHAGAGAKSLDVADTWAADIEDILERVTVGSMPPRPQSPLADEDVARLQGWSLTGRIP